MVCCSKNFQESYITHVDDVNFDNVMVDTDHECEEEVCTHCGGTGVEPKKDIVEDTNFEGIDNVLQLNAQ